MPTDAILIPEAAEPLANYFGQKKGSGVAARIIAEMPPHDSYVEPFAGAARVARLKKPSECDALFELDKNTLAGLKEIKGSGELANFRIYDTSGFHAIDDYPIYFTKGGLAYFDPPYPASCRGGDRYKVDMRDDNHHRALLLRLLGVKCMVIISSYPNDLYEGILGGWRTVDIPTMTRGGRRIERLWCNFPAPGYLHDPRFAGKTHRERWQIHQRQQRWKKNYLSMPEGERQAMLKVLCDADVDAYRLQRRK